MDWPLLQSVGRFVSSWTFTGLWCGGTIILAIWYYVYRFRRRVQPVASGIGDALAVLSDVEGPASFAERFEDLNVRVSAVPTLTEPWGEYRRSLIAPRDGDSPRLRSSLRPDVIFGSQRMLSPYMNLRMCAEMPNYLTGLGILGTFVGLTAGVFLAKGGLINAQPDTIRGALSNLLGGASLAFSTSMVGLIASLIFSSKEKKWMLLVEKGLEGWNAKLDGLVERVTPEQLAASHLAEVRVQTSELRRFNTDLAVSISAALDEKLASRFAPMLDRAIEVLEGVRADRGQENERLLREMVAEFKSSLSGAAGTEMAQMGVALRELSEGIKQTTERLSGAGSEAGRGFIDASQLAAEEMRRLITDVGQQLTASRHETDAALKATLDNFGAQFSALGGALQAASGEAGRVFQEAAGGAGDRIQQAATRVGESLLTGAGELEGQIVSFRQSVDALAGTVQTSDRLLARASETLGALDGSIRSLADVNGTINAAARPLVDASRALAAQMEGHSKALATLQRLATGLEQGSAAVRQSAEQQQLASQQTQARFEGLDKVLSNTFVEIEHGLAGYTSGIRDFVKELDQSMSRATKVLSGAIGELQESVDDLGKRA